MKIHEIRAKYLAFFAKHGHAIVPAASIMPENDPTTLFTGSGMQPMIPYLLGEAHPQGNRIVNSQTCFRAQDIEEVGDNRHTTFFEMLGNWSFGSYFKHEQIPWMFEFLTKELGLNPKQLYITAFRGNDVLGIPRDTESVELWQAQFAAAGVEAGVGENSEEQGMQPGERIFYYGEKKNWWSRSGTPDKMPVGEPGGPDTEMFWDFDPENAHNYHANSAWRALPCHVNCDCGRFMEIGNNVFMEYRKTEQGFEKLVQRNVDFGGGLERIAAACAGNADVFTTDILACVITALETRCAHRYADASPDVVAAMRVVADHIRGAVFILADAQGATPSNVGAGYVLRRLIRRAIRKGRVLGIEASFLPEVARTVAEAYREAYPHIEQKWAHVEEQLRAEEEKFRKTLERGEREFEKMSKNGTLSPQDAFVLFSTYGFPLELTQEMAQERGISVDAVAYAEEFAKHQALSRSASAGAFKGGLADQSVETTRLHTATHLLHQALRMVLGDHVEQKGSNITAERLRFDFSHPQKLTPEEIARVEALVNEAIHRDMTVTIEEMSVDEAKSRGVIGLFEDTYAKVGGKIKVYFMGDFSKEICGGPHVEHTGVLGSFKIMKEEAVSAGVRRIKASVSGLTST